MVGVCRCVTDVSGFPDRRRANNMARTIIFDTRNIYRTWTKDIIFSYNSGSRRQKEPAMRVLFFVN